MQSDGTKDQPQGDDKKMPLDLASGGGVLFSFMVGWMTTDGEVKERDHIQYTKCLLMRLALPRKKDTGGGAVGMKVKIWVLLF